jgi:PHD/YefM family antitoxin component YafN of YafNO toxin-antitoxin module
VTTIRLEDDQLTLGDVAAMVSDGPILVTRHGEPVMAVIALEEDEAETWLLGQSPELLELVEQARRQLRAGESVTLEELRRELDGHQN